MGAACQRPDAVGIGQLELEFEFIEPVDPWPLVRIVVPPRVHGDGRQRIQVGLENVHVHRRRHGRAGHGQQRQLLAQSRLPGRQLAGGHAVADAAPQDFGARALPGTRQRCARLEILSADCSSFHRAGKGLPVVGRPTMELQKRAVPVADVDVVLQRLVERTLALARIDLHLAHVLLRRGCRSIDAQPGQVFAVDQQVERPGRELLIDVAGVPAGEMACELDHRRLQRRRARVRCAPLEHAFDDVAAIPAPQAARGAGPEHDAPCIRVPLQVVDDLGHHSVLAKDPAAPIVGTMMFDDQFQALAVGRHVPGAFGCTRVVGMGPERHAQQQDQGGVQPDESSHGVFSDCVSELRMSLYP